MQTVALAIWAEEHGSHVDRSSDYARSLSSKLIRFRWNGVPTVAVGSEVDAKQRISSVLDAVAYVLAEPNPPPSLNLVLGHVAPADGADPFREQYDAIGTLVASMIDGPKVNVWLIADGGLPTPMECQLATFDNSPAPGRWAQMLTAAGVAPVTGMAGEIVDAVDDPAFGLYPKLSSQSGPEPWQMRLDGLEIGRIGSTSATLHLATRSIAAPGEPRDTWRALIGELPLEFDPNRTSDLVARIRGLIDAWSGGRPPGSVLGHGQAEHALEAHVLSGRLPLASSCGLLTTAVPVRHGVLGAAQFPTLWGDVSRPARYLDALMRESTGRPWAVELKDQAAGGGHGAYLRHGIGQAVLYRHYIRSAPALDEWFTTHGLQRTECQAALAFPLAEARAASTVKRHRELAAMFNVEVMEFLRPGAQVAVER